MKLTWESKRRKKKKDARHGNLGIENIIDFLFQLNINNEIFVSYNILKKC